MFEWTGVRYIDAPTPPFPLEAIRRGVSGLRSLSDENEYSDKCGNRENASTYDEPSFHEDNLLWKQDGR